MLSVMRARWIGRQQRIDCSRAGEGFGQGRGIRRVRFKCFRAASNELRKTLLAASYDAHFLALGQECFSSDASGVSCGSQNNVHDFLLLNCSVFDARSGGEDTLYNMGTLTPVFFANATASE
jgi:hypothetical protein